MIRRDAPCGYCGAPVRPKYAAGAGKGARLQHPKLVTCQNGHDLYRKRDQAG